MPEIGVRELKTRASEILRNVRKNRASYVFTYRGRPVGILMPLEKAEPMEPIPSSDSSAWDELTRLGREVGRLWPKDVTSADVLSKMRR